MLQTLHIIHIWDRKAGKGVIYLILLSGKQKLSSLSPQHTFPYLLAQNWVMWPLIASKEAEKAMKKIVKTDLDTSFQPFLTVAHSEKHILYHSLIHINET